MLVLIDLINTSRCSKTKANTSISQEKGFFFLHNHHPWIPLPKVIGKTLVFVSSILLKRYTISYLSISVFSICVFICICGVEYTYNIRVFFFELQIFAASRLNRPNVWQMPQVNIYIYIYIYFLGFILRYLV